ncbi:MAG: hypothetical protein IT379_01120 [Deltaproteobacteria bacterium]|nr:hypothetical protein [Deltaproteobacteria bacterium]
MGSPERAAIGIGSDTRAEGPAVARAALLNVLAHLVALAAAGLWLRRGSAAFSVDERIAFFRDAESVRLWQVGWGLWILAAAGSVGFIATVVAALPKDARARGAVVSVACAAGIDLLGDTLQAVLLPTLVGPDVPRWVFVACESVVSGIGTVCANGLYSVAVVLLTSALGARASTATKATAYLTFAGGMLLAVSALVPSPWLLQGSAPITIVAFCAWTLALTRDVRREAREARRIEDAPVNRRS